MCRVTLGKLVYKGFRKYHCLGKSFLQTTAQKMAHAPPGHHRYFFEYFFSLDNIKLFSVIGRPSAGGLCFPEYVIYRGEQAYPEYLVSYTIQKPT